MIWLLVVDVVALVFLLVAAAYHIDRLGARVAELEDRLNRTRYPA